MGNQRLWKAIVRRGATPDFETAEVRLRQLPLRQAPLRRKTDSHAEYYSAEELGADGGVSSLTSRGTTMSWAVWVCQYVVSHMLGAYDSNCTQKRALGWSQLVCNNCDKVTTPSERECGTSPRLCFWAHISRYVYRA